ncbi:MAG TPA: hypothetical protein VNZ61_12760 [Roseomonas sp.]|nr:hypothetical protein [Roseomonas sp.]
MFTPAERLVPRPDRSLPAAAPDLWQSVAKGARCQPEQIALTAFENIVSRAALKARVRRCSIRLRERWHRLRQAAPAGVSRA